MAEKKALRAMTPCGDRRRARDLLCKVTTEAKTRALRAMLPAQTKAEGKLEDWKPKDPKTIRMQQEDWKQEDLKQEVLKLEDGKLEDLKREDSKREDLKQEDLKHKRVTA